MESLQWILLLEARFFSSKMARVEAINNMTRLGFLETLIPCYRKTSGSRKRDSILSGDDGASGAGVVALQNLGAPAFGGNTDAAKPGTSIWVHSPNQHLYIYITSHLFYMRRTF